MEENNNTPAAHDVEKLIDFVREKETISRLFTLESTVANISAKAHSMNDFNEFKKWIDETYSKIIVCKHNYNDYVLKNPQKSIKDCLNSYYSFL